MTPVAAAANSLPFKYYHIPSLSNVQLDMNAFLLAARTAIPTFSGIKFSDPDLYTFGRMIDNLVTGEQLFYGKDEMLVPALSIGATGAVGSTYNFMAAVAVRAHQAFVAGNMTGAKLEQQRIRDVVATLIPLGAIPAQKAIMAFKGLPIGGARLPLLTLSQLQTEMLQAQLQAIGFFQWSD
jgi:N-acetylneuraminate lyase